MSHAHVWTPLRSVGKFRCACGVIGYAPSILDGQHRGAASGVKPYSCQKRMKVGHCGAEAVHVTGDRQASRCAEHAPKQEHAHV